MVDTFDGLINRQDIAELAIAEGLTFTDEGRVSILESMRSIDVQACPGSGKTTLIAAKLILLAKKWPLAHQGVCVLSHTNVAKDEIIERLKRSKAMGAQRLLSYPHFIGTIQEFTNRFLALPYLRSQGLSTITVDNDEYVKSAERLLGQNRYGWLRARLSGLHGEDAVNVFLRSTHRLCLEGDITVNTLYLPQTWRRQASYQKTINLIEKLKKNLDQEGIFLYRDMYTHAERALFLNPNLDTSVGYRFPFTFIDEMQDTQKFQDELLRKAFVVETESQIIQRFGDPDQAIFHGIGNEEPNESFNGKSREEMDFVIERSHRFDDFLAGKIRPFSFNEVALSSEFSDDDLGERREAHANNEQFGHTMFLYDDDTREEVAQKFCELVSNEFKDEYKRGSSFSVKIVGGVGNDFDPNDPGKLKIGHYWGSYDKRKAKSNFKPSSLIEAARHCRKLEQGDLSRSYRLIVNSILKLLELAEKYDRDGLKFSAATLKIHLKESESWEGFRKDIELLLRPNTSEIDENSWQGIEASLKSNLGLEELSDAGASYLAYEGMAPADEHEENENDNGALRLLPNNLVLYDDTFKIEFSTIHGVKGETHDASLVLETKNHCFDTEAMLPYLLGELPTNEHPNGRLSLKPHHSRAFKPNQQFLKQFYVAMSRPRHLLCFAMHADRINEDQKRLLWGGGWIVQPLSPNISDGLEVQ